MTVFTVEKPNASDYRIDGALDPTLTLVRGETYTFDFVDNGHPFYIKSALGAGTAGAYNQGVTNQGSSSANQDLVFTVPDDAPDILYYQCSAHPGMAGELRLTSAVEDAPADTNTEANTDGDTAIDPNTAATTTSSLSVIVAPGVLGEDAVYLDGLTETRSDDRWMISYAGVDYAYAEIEAILTTVVRDGAYTAEFAAEIADAYPEYAGITLTETVELVGANALASTLLAVAGADGNMVG